MNETARMVTVSTPWPDRVLVITGDPPPEWFSEAERGEVRSHRLAKRRDEWTLGRAAAKQLAMALGIGDDPRACAVARPHLLIHGAETGWYVSIAHSGGYAAAAIARVPAGVDVQVVRPFPAEAAHLFLSDEETAAMRGCSIENRLLHFWCAKEAAFKRASPAYATLRQIPLRLDEERTDSLRFDGAETFATGSLIVAVSPPAAAAP